MRALTGLLRLRPASAGSSLGRLALLIVGWLLASVDMAGIFALLALGADVFGWGPFLPAEPASRLGWIALLGAVAGLARMVDEYEYRRRRGA
jgi:hypothetical protein